MEVRATAKGVRVSPQKARRIVNSVRGKMPDEALAILRFMPSPTARIVARVVKSAAANAENNFKMLPSEIRIVRAFVDEGLRMKRIRFKARGRVNPILKRLSHITIVVEER
ncbi:MAG: 50S ribosomal protein L22 [Dehalococcoidia bacterium]|nr:50S ribosomal protein L22 [Chloroflexota bacterium]MBT9159455.1 50S ribosomal protein L22 [Chloroflexota bacterium]MBT9161627.1 50S ribosomal protein L22 [Chloroflexota bacterium]